MNRNLLMNGRIRYRIVFGDLCCHLVFHQDWFDSDLLGWSVVPELQIRRWRLLEKFVLVLTSVTMEAIVEKLFLSEIINVFIRAMHKMDVKSQEIYSCYSSGHMNNLYVIRLFTTKTISHLFKIKILICSKLYFF